MKNKGEIKARIIGIVKMFFCLLVFLSIILIGLITANQSFFDLTGKEQEPGLLAFSKASEGIYEVDIFGEKRKIDTNRVTSACKTIYKISDDCKKSIKKVCEEVINIRNVIFTD